MSTPLKPNESNESNESNKFNKYFKYMILATSATSFAWGFYNSIATNDNIKGFTQKIKAVCEAPLVTVLTGSIMGAVYCFGASLITTWFPISCFVIPPLITGSFIYAIVKRTKN